MRHRLRPVGEGIAKLTRENLPHIPSLNDVLLDTSQPFKLNEVTMSHKEEKKKAIVIGGSLGGLFAGNMLRHAGWDVDIYERSEQDLDSRGGGIVLQPDVVELFNTVGAELDHELGVRSRDRITYHPDGHIRNRDYAPQTQTSWSLIYTGMRDHFTKGTKGEQYHQGKTLADLKQVGKKITAMFEDGTTATGDLLIGADGGRSTVRALVDPGNDPRYAGYIAWRGLVEEKDVPGEAKELLGHFAFANHKRSHILGYLVPGDGNTTIEGERFYNWVWYRAVDKDTELPDVMTDKDGKQRGFAMPPGKLAEKWRDHIYKDANQLLPPPFRSVVHATEEPFAQAILDLTSERMVHDRVILVGDAAFIPRPHTAASTAKAAGNALALGNVLQDAATDAQIDEALAQWETPQLRLGHYLHRQGSQTGNYLLFHSNGHKR